MYEIAICDDDAVFAAGFEKMLAQALDSRGVSFHLTLFSDLQELLARLESGWQCHLLFLDVVFAGTQQGISFAMKLREQRLNIAVVFMSASPEFAIDGYDAAPLHFLQKPVDAARLETALDRFFRLRAPRLLCLPVSGGQIRVRLDDVLYFEVFNHDITVHKTGGDREMCVGALRELEEHLPPQTFVRPHRSYLVNLDHIAAITRYQLRLDSGAVIPISKKLYQTIQIAFIEHADRERLDA